MSRTGRPDDAREWVARIFTRAEDVVYVGVGVLLAASALALLVTSAFGFVQSVLNGALAGRVVDLLDQILLVFMIVEILYTVQISFREHALIPEPFLIVGLIAGIRRALVLTAEFGDLMTKGDATFHNAMLELGLLTVMVLALVWALVLVRRRAPGAAAEKA
ncbi:MAG TPA: phosphate-starvation-inducible PsiE family protein [Patescibacteria group bacterium]|nr:phosphate-starvation-inducible PsiE family protein [Patescibacteria group bacterium]